jgi:tRNA A-37 threonylcarbamoyl transferase component Bud32
VVEGERVLGRFTVGEKIGGGGHGTVHRAWDERLCRWVAVKAIEGEAADRVMREAHAAARLNHPGIVTLYELGSSNASGGCAYLVSELVEGPNLRELAARGEISDREVAELGAELCAALAHAHDAGVIHRDLKPDNVLVRPARTRSVKGRPAQRALLADFGIASLEDGPALTATGQVVGTLAYMSPEQAAGEGAAAPSDVYSLGLTLYELWAGFNPVVRISPAATARAIGEPVESLAEARPELPPALCFAIDACLAADPADRPELTDLRDALLELRGALHPDRAVPVPAESLGVATLPPGLPARPFAILLGAGVVALLGALAGLPGLAIVIAALLAPAALMLHRPRDWFLPVLAPLLGLIGAAPAFLAVAARQERAESRAALAGLAWLWTGLVGALLDRGIGVPIGSAAGESAAGWVNSGPTAIDQLLAPMLTPTAIAVGLTWIGGAVLLGVLLDVASPAGAAVGGLIWSGAIVALLGAAGEGAAPTSLLAPALIVAVAWAIWDRADRPDLRPYLPSFAARREPPGEHPRRVAEPLRRGPRARPRPHPEPRIVRRPRNPAASPLADERIRATRTATKHVRAALHGAGSQAGLP